MKKFLRFFVFGLVCYASHSLPQALADDVAPLDDFEAIPLKPFDVANTSVGDGTDWTNVIPNWTITNLANHEATDADAYNGWTALDVDSWLDEQGNQAGRNRFQVGSNNTALVSDPDAWDDFPPAGKSDQGYNSYVGRDYDITGRDFPSLTIEFDWDFVTEDRQIAVAEVSFDGGSTWQNLFTIASNDWIGDATWGAFAVADNGLVYSTNPAMQDGYTIEATQKVFASGTDFSVPGGATTMSVRFGTLLSGNDWWFAVDNVRLFDTNGDVAFDDFEGLTLLPFPDGGVGEPPGDGTDWTDDIVNWIVDNTGMLTVSEEGAFQGWRLLDGRSWANQQGGQNRSFLIDPQSGFPERNKILVADPDAQDDFDVDVDDGAKEFNSYISRTYDVSAFNNGSIKVSFDWETRIESEQRALAEVSFDGGNSWVQIFNVDSDDPASYEQYNNSDFALAENDHFASLLGPTEFQFGGLGSEFAASQSNTMILRFGLIDAENNWWFAVDNVRVEADPISYAKGDANGNGSLTNADISAFLLALTNPSQYASTYPDVDPSTVLDFNLDGSFSNADIGGFLNVLTGN